MDDKMKCSSQLFPDMNPEPVIRFSATGEILYSNPAAKALMQAWQGKQLTHGLSCWSGNLAKVLRHGEVVYQDWSVEQEYYVICFAPISGDAGEVLAVHGYFHNITQRIAAEQTQVRQSMILSSVAQISSEILSTHDLHETMPKVLKVLGEATGVSRAYVFELHQKETLCASQLYEWVEQGIEAQLDNPDLLNIPMVESGFGRWLDLFYAGKNVVGSVHDFPESEKEILQDQGILSMLVMPLMMHKGVWGFIGFDACGTACEWNEEKTNALSIAASSIGAALERQEDEHHLFAQHQALKTARDEALQASKVKSDFLAVMSHELRTPIHGTIGMLQLLQDSAPLSAEQLEYLDAGLTSARSLKLLVNDILDLSKAESDDIECYAEPFSIVTCIREVVSSLRYDVEQKGLYLRLEMVDVPEKVLGDVVRVRQILLNLMGNAVKFTSCGGIVVRVHAAEGHLHFAIEDTGIGISQAKLEVIFEPFTQADASVNREFHGTGLGTTIAKRFVELMGGNIAVRSELGQGSCFTFGLKCQAVGQACVTLHQDLLVIAKPTHVPTKALISLPEHIHVSVLVAEDDPVGQKIIRKRLKRAGFDVCIASDGLEAWDWAQRKDFDLVILDMQMPGMNGADVASHIRTLTHKTGQAFMIGMTAHALSEIKTQCLAAGMDDFMTKPLEAEEVVA
ncbi:MAG: ATP-binding protein, partial [Ghiorsea sp.]